MLKLYLKKLIAGETLSTEESYAAARIIFNNQNTEESGQSLTGYEATKLSLSSGTRLPSSNEQIAAFLVLLSRNGITADELVGFVTAVRENEVQVEYDKPVLDIVGTGGDCANTINISTASGLLIAACGVPVIKIGSNAVTSKCGSADVLKALGYPIDGNPTDIIRQVKTDNFAFCLAPKFHPILAKIRELRKNLGVPTIFNILGPLLNPAHAKHIVLGVYNVHLVDIVANALFTLGTKKSIVYSGVGTDELSCIGKTAARLVTEDKIEEIIIDHNELGLRACTLQDLAGNEAKYNAMVIKETLSGLDTKITDTLILNAAVGLFIYGLASSIKEGVALAKARLQASNILRNNKLDETTFIAKENLPKPEENILKMNKLHEIILRKEESLSKLKIKSLKAQILSKSAGAVIAEIKRASPSRGKIAEIIDPVARAKEYVAAGAVAISVLTDEGFMGTIEDLRAVATALEDTSAAILCKDFFINPMQIANAAEAGANAILIMISVLGNEANRLIKIAHEFGLETLVEVHTLEELEIALKTDADIIGVNQRDLRDFSMHPDVYSELIKHIPSSVVTVAESGIENKADADKVYSLGYKAVLVGTALSKLDNPEKFFR